MRIPTRRLAPTLGAAALLAAGFLLGQLRSSPLAAQPPAKGVVVSTSATAPPLAPVPAGDKRVVAYVYGNQPITREEFGEYLIQEHGRDKIRLFVNKRIIEAAAAKRNIVITPQEIDAIIVDDCGKLAMKKADFVKLVLEQKYGTTLHDWREDVIKPRLMLQRMCKDRIKIDDAELKKVYENMYGEKVQCQIILWPENQRAEVLRMYPKISKDKAAFDDAARSQLSADLRGRLGMVDPIGRHSGAGTAKIEELAFRLKDGQVSEVLDTGGGIMVVKRIKSVPARSDVSFESVKPALIKEATDRQTEQLVPEMFKQIYAEAKPLYILQPANETRDEVEERSRRLGVDPRALDKK